jgi:hypothetical protein
MPTSQRQRFQASSIIHTCDIPTIMQEEDQKEPLIVVAEERQRESHERGFSSYCYSSFVFLGFTIALRCLENDVDDGSHQLNQFVSSHQSDGITFYYYLLLTAALHLLGLWLLIKGVQSVSNSRCQQVLLLLTGLVFGTLVGIVSLRDATGASVPHNLLGMLCVLVVDWFVCLGMLFYAQKQHTAINDEVSIYIV